jgi:hypothetical protein
MSLINRFGALVAVVAFGSFTSAASAAPMFRVSMFRHAAAPPHARVFPIHPRVTYRGANPRGPRPRYCPPGQDWGFSGPLQIWKCLPPSHHGGQR